MSALKIPRTRMDARVYSKNEPSPRYPQGRSEKPTVPAPHKPTPGMPVALRLDSERRQADLRRQEVIESSYPIAGALLMLAAVLGAVSWLA